jgi:hypothetical protein
MAMTSFSRPVWCVGMRDCIAQEIQVYFRVSADGLAEKNYDLQQYCHRI